MSTERPLLHAAGIVAGYGNKTIVRGVTLEISPGEIVAVIGHNGAGKSTLLKALFGLLPLEAGAIDVEGRRIRPDSRSLRAAGISYALQGGAVFTDLSVAEHLRIATLDTIDPGSADVMPELMSLMGRPAGTLSGGERQMLILSMVMATRPRLALLDEPSLGLSPPRVGELMRRLREIREQRGTAFLVVEQRITQILAIADRVYVLRNGQVSFHGPARELDDPERLRTVFL